MTSQQSSKPRVGIFVDVQNIYTPVAKATVKL